MLSKLRRDARRGRPRDKLLGRKSAKPLMRGGGQRKLNARRRIRNGRPRLNDAVLSERPDETQSASAKKKGREKENVIETGIEIEHATAIVRGRDRVMVDVIGIERTVIGDPTMILLAGVQSVMSMIQRRRPSLSSRRKRSRDWNRKL